MKRVMCAACCVLALTVQLTAQTPQPAPPEPARQPATYDSAGRGGLYRETWYDAMLRQFNPDNLDWGQWLEQRRQAILQATAANPYFRYGLVTTLLVILLAIALAKALIDKSRVKWLAQEQYNDLKRHDQSSRQAAREAIRKCNAHMEKCNRVVEGEMAGRSSVAPSPAPAEGMMTLDQALAEKAQLKRERDHLQAELDSTKAMVNDLTMRINGMSGGGDGSAQAGRGQGDVVKQFNDLREQLYRERERNKQLKGM